MKEIFLDETIALDERTLRSLARAISVPRGRFSLILVHCNDARIRQAALSALQEQYSLHARILNLPELTQNLYTTVQQECQQEQPPSLAIVGLETAIYLDELLITANQMRNEFRRQFPFPCVLWLNDWTVQKLIRLAPDFYSWGSPPIRFG